nr:VIT1/CCC1 transporter family protein [Thermaerobacter sp.]
MSTEFAQPSQNRIEPWHSANAASLRQIVFGVNDGLVATVGLVAGLTFAGSSQGVVIGATLAAIVAAVVSMALGSYLSTRTEVRYYQAQVHREKREMV